MHRIDIPDHIKERARARRGDIDIHARIDAKTTALIVIDMQNCFVVPGYSVIEVPYSRDIVTPINRLAKTLRSAGGLVVWTSHSFRKDWPTWYGRFAKNEFCDRMIEETEEGSFGHAIHEEMDKQPNDLHVYKRRYSTLIPGTTEPDLSAELEKHGIKTLIIAGTLTNVCCESTARDSMMMGYDTIFVSDANATRSDAEHNATLISMIQVIADVRSTEEVVQLLH